MQITIGSKEIESILAQYFGTDESNVVSSDGNIQAQIVLDEVPVRKLSKLKRMSASANNIQD